MKITSLEELYAYYDPKWLTPMVQQNEAFADFAQKHGEPNPENFWMWREMLREYTGVYDTLPEPVIIEMRHAGLLEPTHFLHISSNPSLVAYTRSIKNGKRDIQTPIKFGKYLTQLTDYAPIIKPLSELYRSLSSPPELKFARTRQEIRAVYDFGPQSCMKGKRVITTKGEKIAPVEVYAGPDTAVAYLGDFDTPKGVTARCVTNEVDKYWVRCYGDEYQLKELLHKAGYAHGDLSGCRVLKLYTPSYNLIMPYLDGEQHCTEEGEYVVITEEGEYSCTSQDGVALGTGSACTDCGELFDEDELTCVDDDGNSVCESCLESYTYAYVGREQAYVHQDNEDVYAYRGEYYTTDGLSYHNLVLLDGDVYSLDDVEIDFLNDDEYIVRDEGVKIQDAQNEGITKPQHFKYEDPLILAFDLDNEVVYYDVSYDEILDSDLTTSDELLTLFPGIEDDYAIPYLPYSYPFKQAIIYVIRNIIRQLAYQQRATFATRYA